jgi:hypothetical protein
MLASVRLGRDDSAQGSNATGRDGELVAEGVLHELPLLSEDARPRGARGVFHPMVPSLAARRSAVPRVGYINHGQASPESSISASRSPCCDALPSL